MATEVTSGFGCGWAGSSGQLLSNRSVNTSHRRLPTRVARRPTFAGVDRVGSRSPPASRCGSAAPRPSASRRERGSPALSGRCARSSCGRRGPGLCGGGLVADQDGAAPDGRSGAVAVVGDDPGGAADGRDRAAAVGAEAAVVVAAPEPADRTAPGARTERRWRAAVAVAPASVALAVPRRSTLSERHASKLPPLSTRSVRPVVDSR